MEVFVVTGSYDFEGSTVLSVHGSEESAQAEVNRLYAARAEYEVDTSLFRKGNMTEDDYYDKWEDIPDGYDEYGFEAFVMETV